jgi:hypothetical protein
MDLYGFCLPPREILFPHLAGEIMGFGTPGKRFDQWQQHGVSDVSSPKCREYDLTVINIVKYFNLLMQNNPNIVDSIFTPDNCVLHITKVGTMVREKRKMFLHKKCWSSFKGYSYAQMKKIRNKEKIPAIENVLSFEKDHSISRTTTWEQIDREYQKRLESSAEQRNRFIGLDWENIIKYRMLYGQMMEGGKRREQTKIHGLYFKFAYHVVRLLNEVEQILIEGDLDLMRNREQLKEIRSGLWSEKQLEEYFSKKEIALEETYNKSSLRSKPDESAIKELLLNVLEEHYGNLEKCVVKQDALTNALRHIIAATDHAKMILEESGNDTT